MPFISDDSLISLRYAQRLLAGHGLTWTEGPPVEGYSNLLWILASALLGWFHVDLITSVRILGLLCSGLTVAAVVRAYAGSSWACLPAMLSGALVLVLAGPIAVWAIGGLEQPLVTLLLSWAIVSSFPLLERDSRRHAQAASLCLALLCLTRPDGVLFTATTLGAIVWCRRPRGAALRSALALALLPALFVLGQLAFRLAYYGEVVPNTALVKAGLSWHHAWGGVQYVWKGFLSLTPFSQIALVIGAAATAGFSGGDRPQRARVLLLLAHAGVWLAYVALVGGDIFPAYRHFTPVVVVLAFLVAEGVMSLWQARPARRAAALVGLVPAFALYVAFQARDPAHQRAIAERFEWRGQVAALALKRAFGAQQPP